MGSLPKNRQESLQNPLARLLRFKFGNPLGNQFPDFVERDGAACFGILDAAIDASQGFRVCLNFLCHGHIELEVFHIPTIARFGHPGNPDALSNSSAYTAPAAVSSCLK